MTLSFLYQYFAWELWEAMLQLHKYIIQTQGPSQLGFAHLIFSGSNEIRLSARQLIVQCGLKSQLAYIYIYIYMCATSVMLRNAIKSPVTFLIRVITMSVRSVEVLLLQL